MRDALAVWRSTRMTVLAALCAAVYAALIIPLKPIPIIPGFTELRPATVIPILTALLFGPAAAWGCACGTVIADFFGTIGPGSFFGFLGNFVLAYVPYRLWHMLMRGRRATGAPEQAPAFMAVAILASMSCAVVIGWGVDLLGMVPYQALTVTIAINNSLAGVFLGLLLLPLVQPRAQRWGLLYDDVLPPEDLAASRLAPAGATLVVVGAVAGTLLAMNAFAGGERAAPLAWFATTTGLKITATVCSLMILVGCGLLVPPGSGRAAAESVAPEVSAGPGPAVVVDQVTFTYAGSQEPALTGVSLSQEAGQLRMIMGRTGAGKSTLCKVLNGVIPQLDRGELHGTVRLLGQPVSQVPVHALAPVVGVVFQDFEAQLVTGTVEEEVAFPLENMGVPREEMKARVEAALRQVGLWELRHRSPTALSGGQKQRLALAAVLVADPPIVVLDEPTTDLDPAAKRALMEECRRLKQAGKTVIVAEHDADLAAEADVLTVLREGMVAYDGAPEELLRDPRQAEAVGLRPPDIPLLFAGLGRPERPLTVAEAGPLLADESFNEARWQRILAAPAPGPGPDELEEWGPPLVRVQDVHYSYSGGVPALRDVSVDIHQGEFVAILGANGSGKTTLAKLLCGLLKPTRGQVLIGGVDTRRTTAARLAGTIGYLFQNPDHQLFAATVAEEVAFGPRNLGLSPERLAARVEWALEAVGLTDKRDCDPFVLPRGERQLVALAAVLAMRPQVILFDEPTTGLDGVQQQAMMERLRSLNEDGHTVIVITHCNWAVADYAHRALVLADGRLVGDGSVRSVFGNAALMAQAQQRPPAITELCQAVWGKTVLAVDEALYCLEGGRPG